MREAVIVDSVRTPLGKSFRGSLTITRPDDMLAQHFASAVARALTPLRNPHHEPSVDDAARRSATPAAVLIPVVLHESGLTLLLTRRHAEISYPGHLCFPGGRADPDDATPVDTAVREAREEIALAPERVKVIGRLGNYVTHSGFRITPVVGLVKPPLQLVPREREVEEILEIPLAAVFDSRSYRLRRARGPSERGLHPRVGRGGGHRSDRLPDDGTLRTATPHPRPLTRRP